MEKIKKLTTVLLCMLMVMSMLGTVSLGAYTGADFNDYGNGTYGGAWVNTYDEEDTGKGDGTWFLDENGVLTISGWGEFNAYDLLCKFPYITDGDECEYCMELVSNWVFDEESGIEELKKEFKKTRHSYSLLKKIKKIVFSEGITHIYDLLYLEGRLSSVEKIVLPESLLNIDNIGCGNASINLPKNCFMGGAEESVSAVVVKEIEVEKNSVYYSTDEDGNIYNKDKTVLYKYMSSDETFTVPDTVKEIAQYAFAYNDAIKSVTIPGSVKIIKDEAFFACVNLENVLIENGVESIGVAAFGLCISLKEVNIPSTVTAIGEGTLAECWSLKEIVIHANDIDLSHSGIGLMSIENNEKALSLSKDFILAELALETSRCSGFDAEKYDCAVIQTECLRNQTVQKIVEEGIDPLGEKAFISTLLTICCNEGSTAEAYAIEKDIKYVAAACEHTFGEWVADEENGIRYKTCSKCGKTYEEELEADDDAIGIEGNEGENKFIVKLIENSESPEYLYIRGQLDGNIIAVYDINLIDENGNKVQPDSKVKVSLPLGEEVKYFVVLRINEDGTYTDMKAVREGDSAVFETDHFSYYVILGGETEADTGDNIKCDCFCHSHPVFEIIVKIFKLLTKFFGGPLTFSCDC